MSQLGPDGTGRPDSQSEPALEPGDPAAAVPRLGEETNPDLLPARGAFGTALHWLGVIEQAIGSLFLVIILILVLAQVAQRYVPGAGWAWTGEVARLSMVWAAFVLSGYLMAHDRHIAIHVIDYVIPARALAVVKLFAHLVVTLGCLAMVVATFSLITADTGQVTAAAEIPVEWTYLIPFAGFALTAFRGALAILVADIPELTGRKGVVA
ncbi:MAG TPA: TRAP transporter small permease [Candidatus Limnocylindrales bacterium]|nr:TRAP transporter small permease [Candidatus Limnocylindrales bacterium]